MNNQEFEKTGEQLAPPGLYATLTISCAIAAVAFGLNGLRVAGFDMPDETVTVVINEVVATGFLGTSIHQFDKHNQARQHYRRES